MTIVELLLELLLLFVGNCIPGTVVAEERGTDTTRLSSCFVFAWTFCVITCDLLAASVDVDDDSGVDTGVGDVICDDEAFEVVAADAVEVLE